MAIQYENAPIVEALIDIRIDQLPQRCLPTLEGIYDVVGADYPTKKSHFFLQAEFATGESVSASTQSSPAGFSFISRDGRQVFQARLDGFTFSRLKPYGNWSELARQARSMWEIYRNAIGPQPVLRIAVRYINQIDMPVGELDYKDFFRTTPEISPSLPQGLSAFFMQLHMPQPNEIMLVLRQAASLATPSAVILDLDAFQDGRMYSSDDEIWGALEALRERKNIVFEGCLTAKTRALFGKAESY